MSTASIIEDLRDRSRGLTADMQRTTGVMPSLLAAAADELDAIEWCRARDARVEWDRRGVMVYWERQADLQPKMAHGATLAEAVAEAKRSAT